MHDNDNDIYSLEKSRSVIFHKVAAFSQFFQSFYPISSFKGVSLRV